MSSPNNNSDDLTVDACPSYSDEETTKAKLNPKAADEKQSNGTNNKNSYKLPKSPRLKTNTRSSAFASVINISNANNVHIGSNYNIALSKQEKSDQQQQQNNKEDFVITEAIQNMFANSSPVNKQHIGLLSTHMGEGWRDTARALDYSDGQISQIYISNIHTGLKEVIYQLLLDWIQNECDKATVGKLSKILWNTNEKDVVSRWSKTF